MPDFRRSREGRIGTSGLLISPIDLRFSCRIAHSDAEESGNREPREECRLHERRTSTGSGASARILPRNGYDINDVGFFRRPNDYGGVGSLTYRENSPAEVARSYAVQLMALNGET